MTWTNVLIKEQIAFWLRNPHLLTINMVSAFASQLQAIAKNSSHELDLKVPRNAHAESLLFERDVAVKQDYETIYNICNEGYRELCQLDHRFHDFDRNLFSEQAKNQDRDQMSRSENEALDLVLKRCLMLLGGRLLLKPALKALEWLIRRFRVHVQNVDDLLYTVLPYHETPVWANVLSIVPNDKVVGSWKFVRPYLKTTWNIPRHAVAYAAANNDPFFASLNAYTLETCRQGLSHGALIKFWSSIIVEAVTSRIDQTRSGRKEVQIQRTEDLLHKLLSLLSDSYEITGSVGLTTTCYTISVLLAARAELGDHVLDSLFLEVAHSLVKVDHDLEAAFTAMSIIVMRKQNPLVPRRALDILATTEAFAQTIRSMSKQHTCLGFLHTLISSATSHIRRRNAHKSAAFIESLIQLVYEIYPDTPLDAAINPIISKVLALNASGDSDIEVRNCLVIEKFSDAVSTLASNGNSDLMALEGILGMTISSSHTAPKVEQADVEMLDHPAVSNTVDDMFSTVPSLWTGRPSCLTVGGSPVFQDLAALFATCWNSADKMAQFSSLSIWSSASSPELLWQTFLLRFACTGASDAARAAAIRLLIRTTKSKPACDVQVFVPYAIVLLSEAKSIRKAAADLLTQVADLARTASQHAANTFDTIYDNEHAKHLHSLPPPQVVSIVDDVFTPILEECILDSAYVDIVIHNALQPQSKQEMKKSHSSALFSLLTQHALATPLVMVKTKVVGMLSGVDKVGSKSTRKTLLPVFEEWAQLSAIEASKLAKDNGLNVAQVDLAFVQLTNIHDKQYLAQSTQSMISSQRPGLVDALFFYMRSEWSTWSLSDRDSVADFLFDIAFSANNSLAAGARDILNVVEISESALGKLLDHARAGTSDIRGPPTKRRRRSSSGTSFSRAEAVRSLDDATSKISFVLELVEGNSPEAKAGLLNAMFTMLSALRQLQQNRIESPYLLNLCLSSINAMARSTKGQRGTVDTSGVRPEVVTECLRTTDNPQVQNTSLLVLAALSTVVPDRMVHNVMPIFTFISHNMLSKDDEHSINVINEAIDKIVPALLDNLRKGRNQQSYLTSMASMLASFTSAYAHIPQHRRVSFYQKLLFCIDANECGYMLVTLLAHQRGNDPDFAKLVEDLFSQSSATVQLLMYRQLLYLSVDVLASAPKMAALVFNIGRNTSVTERTQYSASILSAAMAIMQSKSLTSSIAALSKSETAQAIQLRTDLQQAFESTLTVIHDTKNSSPEISAMSKECLDHFLQLPSLPDLLEIVSPKLDQMDESILRPQALRILALQINRKHRKSNRGLEAANRLLSKLRQYIESPTSSAMTLATLVCIDRVVEHFGRKSIEAVAETAQTIVDKLDPAITGDAADQCAVAELLTLTGIVEVIREAAVPLVPSLMAKTLRFLAVNFDRKKFLLSIWNATCVLLSALFSHVAFMIPGEELSQAMTFVFASQIRALGEGTHSDLHELMRSMARKVDLEILVDASRKVVSSLDSDVPININGVGEIVLQRSSSDKMATTDSVLDLLSQAVEASPKSIVIRQAGSISELFLAALQQEANQRLSVDEDNVKGSAAPAHLKEVSIKFIYKVNDTTFRPLFESWIDWAANDQTRQVVMFHLLTHFFDTLKAIVTSYASYLLKPISTILKSAVSHDKSSKPTPLLLNTLTLLRTISNHDQDSFFAAPSHFEPLTEHLISCLRLAASKATRSTVATHVIPAITSLATSTMDSPVTHSTLSHHIVQLKSHSSAHVRLASIKTLTAMTEDEELGDEFISNVIGVGAGEGEGARGGGGSVGEIMVYVNEMLEDDDEDVEREVRRWVQIVRGKVGEDVFEV